MFFFATRYSLLLAGQHAHSMSAQHVLHDNASSMIMSLNLRSHSHAVVWAYRRNSGGLCRSLTKLLKDKVQVRLPRSWGGVFRNDYDHRDFCAIGASAGAASAPYFILTNVTSLDKCKLT